MRFVMARAMVRTMLSRYVPVPPHTWRLRIRAIRQAGSRGAPARVRPTCDSISRTPRGSSPARSPSGATIGVDVEYINRTLTHDVAERFFSSQEVADLRALPAEEQDVVFFDYWTLKEAYIKARGLGLALPLGQFTFHRLPGRAPVDQLRAGAARRSRVVAVRAVLADARPPHGRGGPARPARIFRSTCRSYLPEVRR